MKGREAYVVSDCSLGGSAIEAALRRLREKSRIKFVRWLGRSWSLQN